MFIVMKLGYITDRPYVEEYMELITTSGLISENDALKLILSLGADDDGNIYDEDDQLQGHFEKFKVDLPGSPH